MTRYLKLVGALLLTATTALFPATAKAETEHIIVNNNSVLCATPGNTWAPATKLAGTKLVQQGCDPDHPEQIWMFDGPYSFDGINYYRLRNAYSDMCMAVELSTTTPGPFVIQWPCGTWHDHFWRVLSVGGGLYRIINRNSQLCLAVDASSKADNAALIQWPCGSWPDHFWRV